MVNSQIHLLAGLFVCLAGVQLGMAQMSPVANGTAVGQQPANAASTVPSGSSKGALPLQNSAEETISDWQNPLGTLLPNAKMGAHAKSGSAGILRRSLATGISGGASMRLCFQLGVGWQNLPVSNVV